MLTIELIRARDLMRTRFIAFSPEDPLEQALCVLDEYQLDGAPVMDRSGKPVGILTLRALANAATGEQDDDARLYHDFDPSLPGRASVGEWLSTGFMTVGPKASLRLVCEALTREGIQWVFVVDGAELAGVITARDVVRYLAG